MSEDSFTAVIQTENLKRCSSKKLSACLPELNSVLTVVEFITPNVLVFQSKNPKRAGKIIERWLLQHFEPRNIYKAKSKQK